MKVYLITSFMESGGNDLIEASVKKMGHEFEIIDIRDFSMFIEKDNVSMGKLNSIDSGVAIVRGVMNSVRPLSLLVEKMRSRGVKVFDNNFLKHQYSIDKLTDMIKLAGSGVNVIDTYYSRSFDDYKDFADKLGYPVIVKLTRSGQGRNVYKVDDKDKLQDLIESVVEEGRHAKDFIIQKFVPYEHDLRCLVIGDSVNTMKRIPGKDDFRANYSLGGDVEPFDLDSEGVELAKKALSAVDMSVGGVDILITENNERYILEVNHSAGFEGITKATGVNISDIYVEHALKTAK